MTELKFPEDFYAFDNPNCPDKDIEKAVNKMKNWMNDETCENKPSFTFIGAGYWIVGLIDEDGQKKIWTNKGERTAEKLKRCPFCGGEAVYFIDHGLSRFEGIGVGVFGIRCSKCHVSIPENHYNATLLIDDDGNTGTMTDGKEAAIEAWNKRYKED